MYELLYGTGGAPFKSRPDGDLIDKSGNIIFLLGDVRDIMYELKTDEKWKNTKVAIASKVIRIITCINRLKNICLISV